MIKYIANAGSSVVITIITKTFFIITFYSLISACILATLPLNSSIFLQFMVESCSYELRAAQVLDEFCAVNWVFKYVHMFFRVYLPS